MPNNKKNDSKKSSLTSGQIAGIVIGSVFGAIILIGCIIFLVWYLSQDQKIESNSNDRFVSIEDGPMYYGNFPIKFKSKDCTDILECPSYFSCKEGSCQPMTFVYENGWENINV